MREGPAGQKVEAPARARAFEGGQPKMDALRRSVETERAGGGSAQSGEYWRLFDQISER